MFLNFSAAVWLLGILATALPLDTPSTAAVSSHNLYLVTCSQRSRGSTTTFTALAYFADANFTTFDTTTNLIPRQRPGRGHNPGGWGPGGRNPWRDGGNPTTPGTPDSMTLTPDQAAIIANPSITLEGSIIQTKVWGNTVFQTIIEKGANALKKGDIAGSVKLADEDYVCFRDGVTKVSVGDRGRTGGWGSWGQGSDNSCIAEYWCGGLGI